MEPFLAIYGIFIVMRSLSTKRVAVSVSPQCSAKCIRLLLNAAKDLILKNLVGGIASIPSEQLGRKAYALCKDLP